MWKDLLSASLFVVAVFCFYCLGGIHDGPMNREPVSDGLLCPHCSHHNRAVLGIAHTLRNSVVSRASRRLSVFFSAFTAQAYVHAPRSLVVCVCLKGAASGGGGVSATRTLGPSALVSLSIYWLGRLGLIHLQSVKGESDPFSWELLFFGPI